MQRVKRSSSVTVLPSPPGSGTPGFFTGGNPALGQAATVPGYEWFNGVQEELVGLIQRGGIAASDADLAQVRKSLDRLFGGGLGSFSANTTLTVDDAGLVLVNASGGARTITLPAANALGGRPIRFQIAKTDSSANSVTVQRAGADTIEGAASVVLAGQWASVTLVSDGVSVWVALRPEIPAATSVVPGISRFATAAETDAGSLANVAVTPQALGISARNFAASGYQRLPGGLIIQWGRVSWTAAQLPNFGGVWNEVAPGLNVPVTWPIAFPNGCWAAFGNGSDVTGGINDGSEAAIAVRSLSLTGATFRAMRISGSHGGIDLGSILFFAVGN